MVEYSTVCCLTAVRIALDRWRSKPSSYTILLLPLLLPQLSLRHSLFHSHRHTHTQHTLPHSLYPRWLLLIVLPPFISFLQVMDSNMSYYFCLSLLVFLPLFRPAVLYMCHYCNYYCSLSLFSTLSSPPRSICALPSLPYSLFSSYNIYSLFPRIISSLPSRTRLLTTTSIIDHYLYY